MKDWLRSFKTIKEYPHPVPIKPIYGTVPKSLKGAWYKASPGDFDKFNQLTLHPYDGDGFISAIRFEAGIATYQAKFVNTYHRQQETKANARLYTGAFGTPPHLKGLKNPANTSVFHWNRELIVFSDCGPAYRVDPHTLETKGLFGAFKEGFPLLTKIPIIDHFMKGDVLGAHPKVVNNAFIYYTIENSLTDGAITFYEAYPNGNVYKKEYRLETPLYFTHDITVTPDYYLFVQHGLDLNLQNYESGIVRCLKSDPRRPFNVLHAVPRQGADVPLLTIPTQPFLITHHLGYHENCLYATAYSHCFDWHILPPPGFITKIDLDNYTETLLDKWIEFPVFKNKHIYALHLNEHSNTLLQLDKPDKINQAWTAGRRQFLSEPTVDESERYVMCLCFDAQVNKSVVYIFAAETIANGPITILELPEIVPIGLHGTFV